MSEAKRESDWKRSAGCLLAVTANTYLMGWLCREKGAPDMHGGY
jgi:hypothetical protein